MQAFIDHKSNMLKIYFSYSPSVVAEVKRIPGRRFRKTPSPHWIAPFSIDAVKILQNQNFTLDESLKKVYEKTKNKVEQNGNLIKKSIKTKGLYPFQKDGVAFFIAKEGNGINGDDMGLGKTVQTVVFLKEYPKALQACIVIPHILIGVWSNEISKWTSYSYHIAKKRKPSITQINQAKKADIIIINYEILDSWKQHLTHIKTLILDECHHIKNMKAKRTKAVFHLKTTDKELSILGLSGTLIKNRPVEAFPILNLTYPEVFPSFWKYARRYCDAKHTRFGWDFTGASHIDELHDNINNKIMIRRTKQEVLQELPPKTKTIIKLDISNRNEYNNAENEVRKKLQKTLKEKGEYKHNAAKQAKALMLFAELRKITAMGKLKESITWITDALTSGDKLVLYCYHKKIAQILMEKLKEFNPVKIDGDTKNRQEIVDKFQNYKSCKVFIGTLAATEGITLTASSNLAFVELFWTPGDMEQAEDRIHRISQENKVNIYYLLAKNTVDEVIQQMLESKKEVVSQFLDGKSANFDIATKLIEHYLK